MAKTTVPSTLPETDNKFAAAIAALKRPDKANRTPEESQQLYFEMMDQVASSDTLESLLTAQTSSARSLEEFVNVPLTVTNVEFLDSDEKYQKASNIPVFAIINATADGEKVTIMCGGGNVISSFIAIQNMILAGKESFPMRLTFGSRTTDNGTMFFLSAFERIVS